MSFPLQDKQRGVPRFTPTRDRNCFFPHCNFVGVSLLRAHATFLCYCINLNYIAQLTCWVFKIPCDKWVPVTTAWRVLRLRMEERPPTWRVAANILNKQSRTADKGWSSSLTVGRGANNSSPLKRILLRNIHRQSLGPGLILWYNLSNERGTWDLVLGMLGACIGQVH